MASSSVGARMWTHAPLVLACLALTLLPAIASADDLPVPPRCISLGDAQGYCLPLAAIREADALRVEVPALREALAAETLRADDAETDALVLGRALQIESRLLVETRAALRVERERWPAWVHWSIGAGALLVVEVVAVVVLLWAD